MPIEETANIILLINFILKNSEGQLPFYKQYQNLLRSWADYLISVLPDPGDQLCTDDFEGPSPHNVNLAAKGIFGKILELLGNSTGSIYYQNKAKTYVNFWMNNSFANDHYKLQFDLGGDTWSQKYNLIFQILLNLDVFPQDVIDEEINY